MKRNLMLFTFIIISVHSYSQLKLEIEISDLRSNKGNVMIQLFDSTENVRLSRMVPVIENKCLVIIGDLPKGKYAVRYYHDENINGKMETNMVGKPTEGYGFSNNVTGKFGPPPFKKWLFDLEGDKILKLIPVY